jgi:broad specificity phosphatase PhoE
VTTDGEPVPTDDKVVLVRHGETEWSATGRHTSRTDLPLTPEGEEQARGLRTRLADIDISLILSSPLKRAQRTAQLAGGAADVETDDDLVEWDYGEYEGLSTKQIRESVAGWTVFTHPCPGGESLADVGARADRVVARLRDLDGVVLVVSHGHFLRVLAARWIGLDPRVGANLELDVATVSQLGNERDTPTIEVWNA